MNFSSKLFFGLCLYSILFERSMSLGQEVGTGPRSVFTFCDKKISEMTAPEWAHVDSLVNEIKTLVESKCKELPYEFIEKIPSTSLYQTLPDAIAGDQSSWSRVRKFFVVPPVAEKSGSSISGCAILINGDLSESKPANTTAVRHEHKIWDGSIHNSVVVVNGSISMTGYIYDSIVIARGNIKLKSYIYNSLVISCDEGIGTSVDCSDGYVNRAIVVAKQFRPGSARQCVSFGNSNTDDHRGDQVNAWSDIVDVINATGSRELPPLTSSDEKNLRNLATGESLLQELIAQTEITRGTAVANELSECSNMSQP